ncbi:MAG: CoA activase [Candidatus Saganbacteria bacterium]|nr:CoA activase [Candidatus Saganbacteria bacterium]
MRTKAYLGIDIGSISTNLVLLREDKQVLAKLYLMTGGRPIEAVKQCLSLLSQQVGDQVEILGVGTTGSGRYMIGELVGADIIKNEITAQAAAAIDHDPGVDTIFEIGGQDSKYISVRSGTVVNFTMNKVCAAGTGSFLEEQAEKLDINIKEEFAELAAQAESPAPLGDRCTVFIESELNNQLQKGATKAELAAGLARSIVKNYLNKVVETRPVGSRIFFQGGVAFNQAVVKAFGDITGKEITVPPHHEVTGAIGIALIAMKERSWDKSAFKGFQVSQLGYQIKTFECKSCENLCEINMVNLEGEDPLFYGGRCEKWENRRYSRTQNLEPRIQEIDLFKERNELVFKQGNLRLNATVPTIGIPRVLFFFERFPFWNAFFSSLGFDVILSSQSNPKIIEAAKENTATEACFPITLAHGHILDLMVKGVDHIFLPSLINMEKAHDGFTESFNCPFIQALPYFAKAGIVFDKKTRILSPALEPQRGGKHFNKQLISLAKSLGCSKQQALHAAKKAEKEYLKVKRKLKEKGEQVLARIKAENLPALAIISRPYNGADPALNLDIPKKLKELGVLAIPIEYLPISRAQIADEHPNMYWNYGQKLLAAAAFINEHETLSAVHITNFRCGPDSFISHLMQDTIKNKPYLELEVDEHSSDTGVITRLEAFLDSLKNAKTRKLKIENKKSKIGKGKRVLYLPRMSDHALALAAAIRSSGGEAEVLPPSDDRTLELGRQHTSGKECHPFIVTAGDFLKKMTEPGFKPERSAFFMPTASGPCRFGNYHKAHKLIFERLGYDDVPLISPDARDGYSRSMMGLDLNFRLNAWRGIVAVDLLQKLTLNKRAHEKNPGETQALHDFYLEQISYATEAGSGKIFTIIKDIRDAYAAISLKPNGHKPVIGIVGEIFLRCNPDSNGQIVRRIEKLGGVARVAPITEWGFYTNLGFIYESYMRGLPKHFVRAVVQNLVQKWEEHRLTKGFKGLISDLHEPSMLKTLRNAAPYLHYSYKGEAVLSIGKAVDFIQKGASGIINIMPFTCMPGTVVAALGKQVRQRHDDIPWLDLAIDGNEGVNLETRLEAFLHQAKGRLSENQNTRTRMSENQNIRKI